MTVDYPALSVGAAGSWILAVVAATLFLAICRAWLWLSGARRPRSVFAADLLHAPGHARRLELRLLDQQARVLLATLLLLPLFFGTVLLAWPEELQVRVSELRWLLIVVGVSAIAAYFCYLLYGHVRRQRVLRYALQADLAVSCALDRVIKRNFSVFHDVPVGDTTVSKVIVGVRGVFALELIVHPRRARPGVVPLKAQFDGSAIRFPDGTAFDDTDGAAKRARDVAASLARELGRSVQVCPVLVVPGWDVECNAQPAFPVVNERNIDIVTGWIRPELHLLREDVEAIEDVLRQACRDRRFRAA